MLTRLLLIVILVFGFAGCSSKREQKLKTAELFRPDWSGVDTAALELKFGQRIKIEDNGKTVEALVLDFGKDEGGIWYGLCFLTENRLFGRQIPNGLAPTTCVDLLDLSYLNSEGLQQYQLVAREAIDLAKVGVGARAAVRTYSELVRDFESGIEKRKQPQTPCTGIDKMFAGVQVWECYFGLSKITLPASVLPAEEVKMLKQ